MGDLLFVGDVAQVGARFHAQGLAGGDRFIEFFLVQVDQGQLGAFARQVFGHGAAKTLAAAGDDDDFIFELHRLSPQVVSCNLAGLVVACPLMTDSLQGVRL